MLAKVKSSINHTRIYYFPILGQSQAGGFNNAPGLTVVGSSFVKTLTGGPIDVTLTGDLIDSVEGDNFTDTNGGGSSPNVETIATAFGQQLRLLRNSTKEDIYVVSIHARGGETIQALSKGGSTGRYEQIITAVNRVKAIADSLGYQLIVHPLFFHGGTGDNVGTTYQAKLTTLYNNFDTDIRAITGQPILYLFTHQQRIIGTPDYGVQQHLASLAQPKIVVVGPEYPLLLSLGGSVAYQGDNIHITNHGTRYLATIWAQAVFYKIFENGYTSLSLDIANASFQGNNQIRVPILGKLGDFETSGNLGIEIYNSTLSSVLASTCSILGKDLIIKITTPPIGENLLTIRTGLTVNGYIRSKALKQSNFNNSLSNPYPMDKYMVRTEYSLSAFFAVNYILNFGGFGTAPTLPAGYYNIWDNNQSDVDVTYPIIGNLDIVALNNGTTTWWGFTNKSAKSGDNPVTGTNLYNNSAIGTWWFVENRYAEVRLRGLNPNKTYKVIVVPCRPGVATFRESRTTIGGTTIIRQANRSGTVSIFTTEAECAVFDNISPDVNGHITIGVEDNNQQYGYLNIIELIEKT